MSARAYMYITQHDVHVHDLYSALVKYKCTIVACTIYSSCMYPLLALSVCTGREQRAVEDEESKNYT